MDPLFMLISTINLILTLGICVLLFVQQRQIKALLLRPQVVQWNHQRRIKLSEMRGLRPGDLVQLDKQPDKGLIVQIEGRNKYAGSPGQVRGHRAIHLLRRATTDEPL